MDEPLDISVTFTPDRRDAVAAARDYLRLSGNSPVQDGICLALGAAFAAAALWTRSATMCVLAIAAVEMGLVGWLLRRRWVRRWIEAAEGIHTFDTPLTLRFTEDAIVSDRGEEHVSAPWSSTGTRFVLRDDRILFLRGKLYAGQWPAAVLEAVGADRLASRLEAAGLQRVRRGSGAFRLSVILLVLAGAALVLGEYRAYERSPGRLVRWVLDGRSEDDVGGRLSWVFENRFDGWSEERRMSFLLRTLDGVDGHAWEDFSECVVEWGVDADLIEYAKGKGRDVEPILRQEIVAQRWTVALEPDDESGRWALVASEKCAVDPSAARLRVLTGIPVTTEASAHIGFGLAVVSRAGSSTWDEVYRFEPVSPGGTDYRLVRRR